MALKRMNRFPKLDEPGTAPAMPVLFKSDLEEQRRLPRVQRRLERVQRLVERRGR